MEYAAIPLSERGIRQAHRIVEYLPPSPRLVLVSPMIRTAQTAEPYCQRHGVRPGTAESLAEFSAICPTLIADLTGEQRKPYVAQYWADPDPSRRMGPGADTFLEFLKRVREFEQRMADLPDGTIVFGHGIWFGLLLWTLLGYSAEDARGMCRFRRFQLGLPMPNCAVFTLTGAGRAWSVQANEAASRVGEDGDG